MAELLSIVIVNYNTRDLLLECLASIYHSAEVDKLTDDLECIVIDNVSSDGSVEAVRARFLNVRLVANAQNRYFSAAYTQGIELAGGKYVLALNPDTIVQGHTLSQLINQMDSNPSIGAATTTMFFPSGEIQRNGSQSVTFAYLILNYTFLGKLFAGSKREWNERLWYADWDRKTQRPVGVLPGSCIIARKEIWKAIGGFDARMVQYFSDDYASHAIRQLGKQTVYLVSDGIIHHEGASAKQVSVWALRIYIHDLLVYTRLAFGRPAQWLLALLVMPTWFVQRLRAR